MRWLAFLLFASLVACTAPAETTAVETGKVDWRRDFDAALADARDSGKPVFLLFQEVPGCSGCKQFGKDVLGDERLVRIIESDFVPVLVRNNVGGKEGEIRERYDEPAWNYQVVRFLDAGGTDLIPRKDRVWSTEELAPRMVAALEKAGRPVPEELKLMAAGHPPAEAVFAMGCFWSGEEKLGRIEGVLTTEAGYLDGHEVVRLTYDASRISTVDLIEKARAVDCADKTWLPARDRRAGTARFEEDDYRKAPSSDQKRMLLDSAVAKINLSAEQSTKVNAWFRKDRDKALDYLTFAQRRYLEKLH
ncbi:VPGUxxT family thioredoxin-like (seleno)protein, type 2 [Haloferula sargassicola]|uniref:peptide-methionine (S)-S-oxide reductase n=1 Tax=Haloferula sargassicola TaxID=490096 RepID=A0ABP9UJ45_9BACT